MDSTTVGGWLELIDRYGAPLLITLCAIWLVGKITWMAASLLLGEKGLINRIGEKVVAFLEESVTTQSAVVETQREIVRIVKMIGDGQEKIESLILSGSCRLDSGGSREESRSR